VLEVLAVIAIVAYVIGRQLLGESLRGKRVILLPAVLAVIGVTRLGGSGHPVRTVDVVCLAVSALIALGIGLGQGAMMRLEARDGGLWGRMPARSLLLWAALIASRVAMTVLASALGAHVAASSAPIILLLGVNRLGQAAVITRRALNSGIPFAKEKDGSVFLAGRLEGLGSRFTSPGGAPTGSRPHDTYDTYDTHGTYEAHGTHEARDARDARGGYGEPHTYGGPGPYDARSPYDAPDARRRDDRSGYSAGPANALGGLGASLRDLRAVRRQARRSSRGHR
jgi:hypothetical protein